MASKHYNHIHPKSGESYGHMQSKGGDKHLTSDHQRGSAPGHETGGGGMGEKM